MSQGSVHRGDWVEFIPRITNASLQKNILTLVSSPDKILDNSNRITMINLQTTSPLEIMSLFMISFCCFIQVYLLTKGSGEMMG